MGFVTPEQIAQAKEIDLLTYLRSCDPYELVHVGGNTYCTREHDSLKISNGKWNWFSRGIGGKTALDYLIKVQGFSFTQAAEAPCGAKPFAFNPRSPSQAEGTGTLETAVTAGQPVRHSRRQLSPWAGHRL